MYVIRPIRESDFDALEKIAFTAQAGLISLPKDPALLRKKIANSQASLAKVVDSPKNESYLFVLEDTIAGTIGGTSGIYARTGAINPSYGYKIVKEETRSDNLIEETTLLVPCRHQSGPTEMCSLYLLPQYRKAGLGKFLSLSRYLFIASHRNRFENQIIASLRGWLDATGRSPFWSHIGERMMALSFDEISLMIQNDPSMLELAVPKHPLYIPLLPEEVQEVIGKPHDNSRAALQMLYDEGFEFAEEVDLLDGGPKVIANTEKIRTVKESVVAQVVKVAPEDGDRQPMMIGTLSIHFRCCMGVVDELGDHQIGITESTSRALNIKSGDYIRYIRIRNA